MLNRYHVVAVTPDLEHTLATLTPDGWLLPWIEVSALGAVPRRLQAMLQRAECAAELVHTAFLRPEITDQEAHSYCAAVISTEFVSSGALIRNSTLTSSRALIPRQREALTTAVERLRSPIAPFDSRSQMAAAIAWSEQQIASVDGARLLSTTKHACGRYGCVIQCETTDGTMYLKAGQGRVDDEATQTELLRHLTPSSFPETVSIDRVDDRWLCRALAGHSLAGEHLTLDSAVEAVRTLVALQKGALATPALREHLVSRDLTALGMLARADEIIRRTWVNERADSVGVMEMWSGNHDQLATHCSAVDALDLPRTIVLTDFVPGNVIVTAHGIGFIDVGNSHWTHPFVALSRFIKQVERYLASEGRLRAPILDAFIDAWSDVVSPAVMRRALGYLNLLNRLLAIPFTSRSLDARENSMGGTLPDWYRRAELAPFADYCVEALRAD